MKAGTYCLAAIAVMMCMLLLQGCPPKERERVESKSASGNVIVTEPQPDSTVSSPVTVKGRARVFEAALSARVVSDTGSPLGTAHFMTSAGAPEFGTFDATISYRKPTGVTRGFVEVFTYSAKDGSVQDLVRIPVLFR